MQEIGCGRRDCSGSRGWRLWGRWLGTPRLSAPLERSKGHPEPETPGELDWNSTEPQGTQGRSLTLAHQSVLSAQFETTNEFGSLLRANTPVSRMMTTYTRRGPGQSYLKSVLADRINSLIEHKDLNLEINPLKVGTTLFWILPHPDYLALLL